MLVPGDFLGHPCGCGPSPIWVPEELLSGLHGVLSWTLKSGPKIVQSISSFEKYIYIYVHMCIYVAT